MTTNKKAGKQKLVQVPPSISYDNGIPKTACTKKRARRKSPGHIEPFQTDGRTFYRYRRGTDPPEYLGTAEAILQWKREIKAAEKN